MDSRFLLAAAACLGGALGWSQLERLDQRLASVEDRPEVGAVEFAALGARLERIEANLLASHSLLEELGRSGREVDLEAGLRELESSLLAQSDELTRWHEEAARGVTAALEGGLSRLDEAVDEGWRRLTGDVASAARLAHENRSGIKALREREQPDLDLRWRELLGPTVQLAGSSTVGSGVLLDSRPTAIEGEWRTELLTAWHVVRDILPESLDPDPFVPVRVYRRDGTYEEERARLVEHEPGLDVAILALESTRRFENGARLAPRSRLEGVRIFDRIYAVGCPLGNDPLPTFGEISETRHGVDGGTYWMVSAPTYIGNSGGGIFDADSHELLAIFSKIYTHGGLRPTVVPHMGLAVPLDRVYDWLATRGLAGLLPAQPAEVGGERPQAPSQGQTFESTQRKLASSQRDDAQLETREE